MTSAPGSATHGSYARRGFGDEISGLGGLGFRFGSFGFGGFRFGSLGFGV